MRLPSSIFLAPVCVAAAILVTGTAQATSVPVTPVRGISQFTSISMDPTTGQFYDRGYYYGAGFTSYASATNFEANIPSGSVLLDPDGTYGPYFAVNSGKLFGRGSPDGTDTARWDAATGTQELTNPGIPDMGGSNGNHGFTWGGYSAVNWLQDSTGLYVFGKQVTGDVWQLNRMDQNLNVVSTYTFADTSLGFAFMIGGNLFTGPSYGSPQVTKVFNVATQTRSDVDFTLDGMSGVYLSNTLYDPNADVLYLVNTGDETLYKLPGAAQVFGVPEPSSLALAALGLAGAILFTRRRYQTQA